MNNGMLLSVRLPSGEVIRRTTRREYVWVCAIALGNEGQWQVSSWHERHELARRAMKQKMAERTDGDGTEVCVLRVTNHGWAPVKKP